jgi:hypothetical protein
VSSVRFMKLIIELIGLRCKHLCARAPQGKGLSLRVSIRIPRIIGTSTPALAPVFVDRYHGGDDATVFCSQAGLIADL